MDWFRSFALDGIYLPAFLIAAGSAMILAAPHRPRFDPEEVRSRSRIARYLATRRWDRRGGWAMVARGVLILALRLMR